MMIRRDICFVLSDMSICKGGADTEWASRGCTTVKFSAGIAKEQPYEESLKAKVKVREQPLCKDILIIRHHAWYCYGHR